MAESTYEEFVKAVEPDGWDLDDPAEAVTLAAYMVTTLGDDRGRIRVEGWMEIVRG